MSGTDRSQVWGWVHTAEHYHGGVVKSEKRRALTDLLSSTKTAGCRSLQVREVQLSLSQPFSGPNIVTLRTQILGCNMTQMVLGPVQTGREGHRF